MSGSDEIQRLADHRAISDLAVRYCSNLEQAGP